MCHSLLPDVTVWALLAAVKYDCTPVCKQLLLMNMYVYACLVNSQMVSNGQHQGP